MESRERIEPVQAISKKKQWRRGPPQINQTKHNPSSDRPESKQSQKYTCCGRAWPHKGGKVSCPAWGATCHKCQKKNHFAKFCKQRPNVHFVNATCTSASTEQNTNVEDYVFHAQSQSQELPVVTVSINSPSLEFCVDSGAGVNVIGETTWRKHLHMPQLERTTTKLVPYGVTQEIIVMGKFSATFRAQGEVVEAAVYAVRGAHQSLLSYKTASDLKLITIL